MLRPLNAGVAVSERRSLPTIQLRAAMGGVVAVEMSWPYRHIPASRRRESLAARPAQRTLELSPMIAFAIAVALSVLSPFSEGMEISKPSSPV